MLHNIAGGKTIVRVNLGAEVGGSGEGRSVTGNSIWLYSGEKRLKQ